LDKDQGEEVYWFETNSIDAYTDANYSTKIPDINNINFQKYETLLTGKLKDTLDITEANVKK